MNQKEIDLRMAAAGYPIEKKSRRKPRIKFNLENPEVLRKIKLEACRQALDNVGGHRAKAARTLGIHVRTIYKWIREMES